MKKILILTFLMLIGIRAHAEPIKLLNISEDTTKDDSYKPVAGKEFLVAVKLVDVDVELNTEQPISNEPIIFQTSIGSLSETEVTTNIYGEAIAWLTTNTTPDTSHSITASAKDKPEITPIIIQVKNIALPQDAPTAEELIQKVEENNDKIQDIKGDITITSNRPESSSLKEVKIWRKGNKQRVEELSPKPAVYIRPEVQPVPTSIVRSIVAFNHQSGMYAVCYKEETQEKRFPYSVDYIDSTKGVIIRTDSYIGKENVIRKFIKEDTNFAQLNTIWVFMEENKHIYQGIGKLIYTDRFVYSNIEINTGLPDNLFQ